MVDSPFPIPHQEKKTFVGPCPSASDLMSTTAHYRFWLDPQYDGMTVTDTDMNDHGVDITYRFDPPYILKSGIRYGYRILDGRFQIWEVEYNARRDRYIFIREATTGN